MELFGASGSRSAWLQMEHRERCGEQQQGPGGQQYAKVTRTLMLGVRRARRRFFETARAAVIDRVSPDQQRRDDAEHAGQHGRGIA